jgi:hypothetical protein
VQRPQATHAFQANDRGLTGSVCTVYELHSGEDVEGTELKGLDETVLRAALAMLEVRPVSLVPLAV